MTVWKQRFATYRQDNPASIVVQKPQCSGAIIGAPAWASNSRIVTLKTSSAEEKIQKRLRMGMRLVDIMVELWRGHLLEPRGPALERV